MPRKLRVWHPGAIYHITCRGNRKAEIFQDSEDRRIYLAMLMKTRERNPFHVLSYCLMTNHIHLQIKTIQTPPSDIMHFLNSKYAIYYNKKYEYTGHLFQGRYGAKMITSIKQVMDASRYIQRNPVEANLVNTPEQYQWSSYKAYISNVEDPHVDTSYILSFFPEPKKLNYKAFVEKEQEDSDLKE